MDRSVHKEYIDNLIDSMLHNMDEQSSNIMLIEHYNTLDLSYNNVMEMAEEKSDVKFLYHSYFSPRKKALEIMLFFLFFTFYVYF